MKQLLKKLTKARTQLILDHPFFGSLAMRLGVGLSTEIPTAATDGRHIYWNPDFLESLSNAEVRGVLAHEVLHVTNGHCWRRGDRDHQAWNVACDQAINSILEDCAFRLPDGVVPGIPDKSAEELYKAPEEGNKGEGEKGQSTSPSCGEVLDGPSDTTEEEKESWKVAATQAASFAKSQGALPGSLDRMIKELVNPGVDWRVLLKDFIDRTARNDYDWTRPSRRYGHTGCILPGIRSDELPEIVVAVDTSGSIDKEALEQFASEISSILGTFETTIHVVYCDTEVRGEQVFQTADLPLSFAPVGGGGTKFDPPFEWVERKNLTPACFIYLTDLCGRVTVNEPEYPVLWVTTCQVGQPFIDRLPFGEVAAMVG